MVENVGNEMRKFIKDLKQNIKDPLVLQYLLKRTESFFDAIFHEMEAYADEEEKKLNKLRQKQDKHEKRMDQIEDVMKYLNKNINNICNDIYDEEAEEFEINCPYCNYEFNANIDENNREIICPECNNIIELDWSGVQEDQAMEGNENIIDNNDRGVKFDKIENKCYN